MEKEDADEVGCERSHVVFDDFVRHDDEVPMDLNPMKSWQ